MTAPTHAAFGLVLCKIFGIPSHCLSFAVAGALLPDIDHPHSALGRIFFFISHPLNAAFGHRTLTHSIFVWILPLVIGFFFQEYVFWLSVGAISHLVIDSLNTSGVQMFYPYSKKTVVLGGESWRFPTASKQEFILLALLGFFAWAGGRIGSIGGFRSLVGLLTGNYDLVVMQYQNAGTTEYFVNGKWREISGQIIEKRYEVIGENGKNLVLWDAEKEKIYNIPKDLMALRVHGEKGEKEWKVIKINGWVRLKEGYGFFWNGKDWIAASMGDVVFGVFKTKGEVEFENL